MAIPAKYRPSLEAIQYQGKSLLFNELTMAIERFRETKDYSQAGLDAVKISAIIKKYTGLQIEVLFRGDDFINAWIEPPLIDVNSTLWGHNRGSILESFRYDLKKVGEANAQLRGSVNLATGKVNGIFSLLPAKMTLLKGVLAGDQLSAEEAAAITLHEIGHLFTYFEKLVTAVTMNMAIAAATEAVFGADDVTHKVALIDQTAALLDAPIENTEQLAQVSSKEEFQAVLIKATCDKALHSATGSSFYDMRSCEFLADQFATRQGAGRPLATALDKMFRTYNAYGPQTKSAAIMAEALKMAGLVLIAWYVPIVAGLWTLLLLSSLINPEGRIYDEPGERLQRIKRDLVQLLKDTTLDPVYRKRLLADVDVLSAMSDDLKATRSFFNYLWIACTSRRRNEFTQLKFQQQMEKLVNNDLFTRAAKLADSAS